ncbi:MAG: hypothetical protein IPH32_12070 [Bacteroidetes bacterium]|nr:hypothetical protein [Bacteroidota bacterium]
MKKSNIIASLLIVASIITLNSCKKKTEVDNESQSVVDNAICEQQFMAIQPVVSEKGIQENGIKRTTAALDSFLILGAIGNPTITPSANDTIDANADGFYDNGPVTFELKYLPGFLGNDGIPRTGSLKITTAKRWSAFNNTVTVDLVNFVVNGTVTYSGQVKITRTNALSVTCEVLNGHCTNGSWNIDYQGTKTLTQKQGQNTPNTEADDVYEITGNSSGVNREGRAFTTNITNPLVKKSSCKFITSGSLDLTPDGFKTRTVDFGSGACDDDATYTVNGQTISFKLK